MATTPSTVTGCRIQFKGFKTCVVEPGDDGIYIQFFSEGDIQLIADAGPIILDAPNVIVERDLEVKGQLKCAELIQTGGVGGGEE